MKVISSLLLMSALAVVHADPIDDFIKAEMGRNKSPGIALGIVKDGKLVKHEVYGSANLELDVPVKKGDLFEIGSITKQFTAVATMMLVEDEKIKLDDPITKYLDDAPKAWEGIKIRNLLYQTSGLSDYAFEEGIGLLDEFDRKKWMDTMSKMPLDFQPGAAWAYSNTNFALLGWIIEKSAGMGYMSFMRERIFKPLGMNSTTFSDPAKIIPHRTAGYLNMNNQVVRCKFSAAVINSDGTIMSNIEDMVIWDAALKQRKLLKASSYDLLWKAAELKSGRWRPYSMGFNVSLPGTEPYYGHAGNSAGYSAGFACYPKANISVIVMGNIYAFSGEGLAKQVAELYEPSLKPTSPATKSDPDAKRTDSIRQALLALGSGKADDSLFEEEVLAPMKTRRAGMGAGGLAPLQALEKVEFAGEMPVGKDRLLTYKIFTKTRNFVGTILWSAGGKVAMASLRVDGPVKTG